MVRLAEEHYCYNEQCLYQWCDRCTCSGTTIDATGRCATCVPIRLSPEELKAYKRKHFGGDLEELTTYAILPQPKPEWKAPTYKDFVRIEQQFLNEKLHRYGRKDYPKKKRVRK